MKKKTRRKKIMKVALIILAILLLAGLGYLAYKLTQLNKLKGMTASDMIAYVTEEEGTYVSMAIIENGQITYHTYGQNGMELEDTDYQYEIGSISKTMAALLVSKAIEEGKIELTAPISQYLDLPEEKYYPTIERLLTHTSGYKGYYFDWSMTDNWLHGRNDFYGVGKDKILDKVSSLNLKDKDYPFNYSNFGISVIGLVLEAVYQKDYSTLLQEYLVNEMHLENTTVAACKGNLDGYWDWACGDGYIPAGAVISDIYDMGSYLNTLMTSDTMQITRPLSIIKKVTGGNNSFYESMGIRIDELGMTWIHDTQNHLIWHNGGTSHYNSYIAMSEDRTKGIVILSNYGPDKKIPVTVIGAKIMEE